MEYALNSFMGGEVSRRFAGRTDLQQVRNGCELLKNMIVLPEGSIIKTPGLLYYKSSAPLDPTKSRLFAIKRSTGESYLLEMYPIGGVVVFEIHTSAETDTGDPINTITTNVNVTTDLITVADSTWADGDGFVITDITAEANGTVGLVEQGADSTASLLWGSFWDRRNGSIVKFEAGYKVDDGEKIVASGAVANDQFGYSVAISGDYAIVGAVGGDAGGDNAGAAYIFHRTDTWDAGTEILASDAEVGDSFGYSVSISGDYAIVGARYEASGGNNTGAAYIFHRTGTNTWDTGTKIVASDAEAGDFFSSSVAISGDYAIAGASSEGAGGDNTGAAYIFHRTGTDTWDTGTKIVASDAGTGDHFGDSVAISGDYAIAGAPFELAGGLRAGAAYVFHRRDGSLPGSIVDGTEYYAYQIEDNGNSTYDISIHSTAKDGASGANSLPLSPVADTNYHVILHKDIPNELDPGTPYFLKTNTTNAEIYPTRANAIAGASQITLSGEEANFELTVIPLSDNKTISSISSDDLAELWFTQWSEKIVYMTQDGNVMRKLIVNDLNDLAFYDVAKVGGEQISVSTYHSFNTVNASTDRVYFLLDDLPQLRTGTVFTAKGTWPATCLTVDTNYYLGSASAWEIGTEEASEIVGVSYKVYATESDATLESSPVGLSDQSDGTAQLLFGSAVTADPETPAIGGVYESRLVVGGGTAYPDALYGSMVGEPERFHKLTILSSHSWEFPVAGAEYDTIRWVAGGNVLLVATKNAIYKMGGENDLVTPQMAPITRPQSSTGAAAVPPIFFEDFIVYVGEGGKRIYALTYSEDVAKYQAVELSVFSEHLFDPGVKRIEMQRSPYPVLWVLLNDGTLLSMVYHKDTQVIAWSQHDFGVVINDICSINSTDGDDPLYVQGSLNGYHILCRLRMNESDDLYIDSINNRFIELNPTTTVSLPEPYWSQTVRLVIDGVDNGDVSIPSNGIYTIETAAQGGAQYVFGTILSPEVKTNAVVESLMSKKRISEIMVQFTDTSTFKVGRDSNYLETVALTGHEAGHKIVQVAGGWDTGQVYLTKDEFGSMLITSIISEVDRA